MTKSGNALYNTILSLVMVALVIVVLLVLVVKFYKLIAPGSSEITSTKNNFESLVKQIKALPESEYREMPLYINKDYFVIGFSELDKRFDSACSMSTTVVIQRPGTCAKRCLCLCRKDDGCAKSGECRSFEGEFFWSGGNGCSLAFVEGHEKPQTAYLQKSGSSIILYSRPPKQ